jgi:hypothetical protein
MPAVVSLVVIVTLGLIVARVATVALHMTGMPLEHARFQARSALTGTGFTTSEAESVVDHPVRRRIVMLLMLVSGAGALSVIGTLILSFGGVDSAVGGMQRAAVIVVSMIALFWLFKSRPIDAALRRVIEKVLARWANFEVDDYAALLHLQGEWTVAQMPVGPDDWIASLPLGELRLPDEGVALMGVERSDGTWVGAPTEEFRLQVGDVVVLYGRTSALDDISRRLHDEEGTAASERARARHASAPPSEPLTRRRRARRPASP